MSLLQLSAYLLAPVAATTATNFTVRFFLQGSSLLAHGESSSRVCAALCAALVCAFTLAGGELRGTAAYAGYVVADTVSALWHGPLLRLEILVHHAVTLALCLLAFSFLTPASAPLALPAAIVPLTRALLLMEASNPFLHASWIADREKRLRPYRLAILSWSVPGVLSTFLWFRVVQGWACVRLTQGIAGTLGAWYGVVQASVLTLLALQVYWYWMLLRMLVRVLLGQKGKEMGHTE